MDEVDSWLERWGRDWRRAQPEFEPRIFDPKRTSGPYERVDSILRLVGLVIAATGALLIGSRLFGNSPGLGGSVPVGVEVVARGTLVSREEGFVELCVRAGGRLNLPAGFVPECSDIAVRVVGVDLGRVPGWTTVGAAGYAMSVEIQGTWAGAGQIEAESVERWNRLPSELEAPCAGADAGLPGDPEAEEAGTGVVAQYVAQRAAEFGIAYRVASGSGGAVLVVQTVKPVEIARQEVARIYRYPFCVVPVEHSTAALEALRAELAVEHPEWLASIDGPANRVRIVVVIEDDELRIALGDRYSAVLIEPLVSVR